MMSRKLLQLRFTTHLQRCTKSEDKVCDKVDIKSDSPAFSIIGDDGTSRLNTGEILPKDNKIFHAIGAAEELLSYIGLARAHAKEGQHEYCDKLKRIQTTVIDLTTEISNSTSRNDKPMPPIYTKELEDWIKKYSKQLSPPEEYIVPGGSVASASLHVARSICRKTERSIVPIVREGRLDKEAQVYLNRLADFLFIVSRIAAKLDHQTETIYIPKPKEESQSQTDTGF